MPTTPRHRSGPSTSARRSVAAIVIALAVLMTACSSSDDSALEKRPFTVHLPPGYRKGKAVPLLVVLHGYAFTGKVQSLYFHLAAVTDAHGMMWVAPDGTKNDEGKQFWNATDACCAPAGSTVDDSAYLAAVIDNIRSRYDVDPRRIYVMGHSNGGFMAYRMACDHADVVAAVVSLEGATYADPSKCSPSEPVAALEVHGDADTVIRYEGGRMNGSDPNSASYPSAADTTLSWARLDHCKETPDDPAPATRAIVSGLPSATVTSYGTGCDRGGHAELWTQPGGNHVPDINQEFTEQAVSFMLAHPKPK
ncbi:MAG: PHB depolymerase family esterase [Acidimicrobiales bacterium]